MDYKSVLFSVEDANQDLACSPTALEEPTLIDVYDQDVVAVDYIRMPRAWIVSDLASRFLPDHSGSPQGSATASQKSLSVSIRRPRRSTVNALSFITAAE